MQRRLDLDWIRIAAFGLLVLYHCGMYYVSWDWHVKSPHASETLEPLMMLSSPWRLSLLFLVSGVATAFLFAKRPAGFLGGRSWRLLVPLVFGMLVIVTPQAYYEVVEKLPGGYHDGYLAFWGRYLAADDSFCRDGDCLDVPTWNHLWFVVYLWVYTVVAWALLRFAPRGMARSGDWLTARLSGIGILLWPALLLAVARVALVGHFESTHALVDDWYNHAQYLPLFLLGILVATRDAVASAGSHWAWRPPATRSSPGISSAAASTTPRRRPRHCGCCSARSGRCSSGRSSPPSSASRAARCSATPRPCATCAKPCSRCTSSTRRSPWSSPTTCNRSACSRWSKARCWCWRPSA
jgi:hypothetical protein